jgi:hypothetical protein
MGDYSFTIFSILDNNNAKFHLLSPNNLTLFSVLSSSSREHQVNTYKMLGGNARKIVFQPDRRIISIKYVRDNELSRPKSAENSKNYQACPIH